MSPPADVLDLRGEFARKGLHLLALVLPAAMLVLPTATALPALVGLAALAIAVEIGRDRSAAVHAWIDRWFGWMMRPEERPAGSGFCGATWVVATAALLLAAFPAPIAAAGMTIGLAGDAAAAIVGRTVGRHPWPRMRRTVEGTAAFAVAGLAVAALFPGLPWPARLGAVAAAAVAELLPLPVNDNLLVPFVAAGVLALLA